MGVPEIVITQGTKLKLDPANVRCEVLTDDLCVLVVDFEPRYKEVEAGGHLGTGKGVFFRLLPNSPDYNLGDDDVLVELRGDWGPDGTVDSADNWLQAVDHYRANTMFYIAFYRCHSPGPRPVLKVSSEEWED